MKHLETITDQEALKAIDIVGGASHLSNDSKIHQFKELMEGRFNKQTNIPGIRWYRMFKYLESKGYKIEAE